MSLFDVPDAVGFGLVFDPGEESEVPDPGLPGRLSSVGVWDGVIQLEAAAVPGGEREHRGGMPGADRGAKGVGGFVGVHGGKVRGVENRAETDLAAVPTKQIGQLRQQDGAGVVDAHHSLAGLEGLIGEMDVDDHSRCDGFQTFAGEVVGQAGHVTAQQGTGSVQGPGVRGWWWIPGMIGIIAGLVGPGGWIRFRSGLASAGRSGPGTGEPVGDPGIEHRFRLIPVVVGEIIGRLGHPSGTAVGC